jgi:uncharacterized repeat protein (TIGR01451 family)
MGNGRWWGGTLGKRTLGKSSETGLVRVGVLGAMFMLLVAGSGLLGLGSRRSTHTPASPIPTLSKSSLKSKPGARAILGQLPIIFEPNRGQADPRAKFLARGPGYSLFLKTSGAVLAMQTAQASRSESGEQFVNMTLLGANPAAALTGADPLPGKSNYLIGNDPHKWHSDIPQFGGVRYASVYPGIDLIFYGNQGRLEYDFRVAPGADPSQAELQFDGASKLELSGGDLILTGEDAGGLRLQAPQVYQRDGDRHKPVAGHFVLRAANRVGFEIGPYDRSRELIIDPVLVFSTYFGGTGTETSPSVAVNGNGNIYIVGTTQGSPVNTSTTPPTNSFPPTSSLTLIPSTLSLTTTSPSHIFVAEINPSQPPSVVYETFIGGTGSDSSIGIGVDNGGNAYIVGNTSSTDFPHAGIPYQTAPETKTQCAGSPTCTSVFVTVLNPTGSAPLIYSSYLSGNGDDQASGMAIDTKGDVFITGTTTSQDTPSPTDAFPATYLPVPYQATPKASLQFFVTELNTQIPSVGGVAYSTYFGGATPAPAVAIGGGIAVDAIGNMYFSGTTNFINSGSGAFGASGQSEDFPIVNAYQPCLDTPPPLTTPPPQNPCTPPAAPVPTDAFVAKINPLGAVGLQLLWSTYFGGAVNETGPAVAVDFSAANIYLTGETNSSFFNLPTGISPFQLCLDTPPVTPPVLTCSITSTPTAPAPFDAYVARLTNPTQNGSGTPVNVALTYFTYLGGTSNDSGAAIAVLNSPSSTPLNDVVLTGATSSTNFPVTITPTINPIQSHLNGTTNSFFAEINTTTTVNINGAGSYVTYFGGNGVDHGTGIAVDPNLNSYFVGDTTSTNFEVKDQLQSTLAPGATNAFVVELGSAAELCITCVAPVLSTLGELSAGNQVTATFTVANEGPDPATNVEVNATVTAGVTLISATANSGTCSSPTDNALVCQIPTLQSGSLAQIAVVVAPIGTCTSCSVMAKVSSSNNTNASPNTATASFVAGGYTASISPPQRTVAAGLTAQYAVSLSPSGGAFPGQITLSCSALPTGANCAFTSNTVTFSGGTSPASVGLNLTTTAQPVTTVASAGWRHPFYALWLMVPGMALLGVGSGRGRRKKTSRLLGMLGLSLLFALTLLQPSCSGGTTLPAVSGTPSGTYSLTITATSGTFTQSQAFSLTVVP